MAPKPWEKKGGNPEKYIVPTAHNISEIIQSNPTPKEETPKITATTGSLPTTSETALTTGSALGGGLGSSYGGYGSGLGGYSSYGGMGGMGGIYGGYGGFGGMYGGGMYGMGMGGM